MTSSSDVICDVGRLRSTDQITVRMAAAMSFGGMSVRTSNVMRDQGSWFSLK